MEGLYRAALISMKTRYPALFLLAAALFASAAPAQVPSTGTVQSLRVLETPLPVYPHNLLQLGIREGECRVALSVDKNGNIEDCLPIAYTHPEFARVTMAALKKWRFDPARYMGEPIAAATEVQMPAVPASVRWHLLIEIIRTVRSIRSAG